MTSELSPDYPTRGRASHIKHPVLPASDDHAEIVTLNWDEAFAGLGFINALIEVLELGHAKPNQALHLPHGMRTKPGPANGGSPISFALGRAPADQRGSIRRFARSE